MYRYIGLKEKKMKDILYSGLKKVLGGLTKIGISKNTPGALPVYKFFDRIFWPYKSVIEIQGSKMWINPDEKSLAMRRTLESYAVNLIHEEATTKLFKETVKPGNTVIDLGANIGYFTLLAAKLVGSSGKVYAFEPEPRNFKYLKKNLELNGYSQVAAHQAAASDKRGKTKLFICEYETGHHTINQSGGIKAYRPEREVNESNFVEINTVSLDEIFAGKEDLIDVMKIDIEGAEALAIRGMDKILSKNKKLKIFMEYFPMLIKNMGSNPEDMIGKILGYGFSISVIPDDYEGSSEMKKIAKPEDISAMQKEEKDHFNLLIYRNNQ